MGMRIIWALFDTETGVIECFFEAENLLVDYREQLLRRWYDDMTRPVERPEGGYLPDDQFMKTVDDEAEQLRNDLLNIGYERWRNDQVFPSSGTPRYITQKYELWNSVPPNVERLVLHFDVA